MSNKKDIYELLNDIEFDITSEKEVPINDIQKKRIKKRVKSRIRKPRSLKKKYITVAVSVVCILTLISPMGREIVAKIVDGIFFNPGLGLVNTEEDVYVLKEPIAVDVNGQEVLIKSVLSKENEIYLGIWVEYKLNNSEAEKYIANMKDNFRIKLPSGQILDTNTFSISSGGKSSSFELQYETEGIIKEFALLNEDREIANIGLVQADKLDSYNSVGGNYVDNGIMVGGNKYYFNGETYVSLWSKDELSNSILSHITYPKDNIFISNKDGNTYSIEPSEYDGKGKEFVISEDVKEQLNISINKVNINYSLKSKPNIKVEIPKKGEEIELNQEIYFSDIDEKILLKSIKSTEKGIELYFDTAKYKKDNSSITMITADSRNHGGSGEIDKSSIIMMFDYEDLTTIEKISGKLNFDIGRVDLIKDGNWSFEIE